MTPLSSNPDARERSLANLKKGGAPAPAGNARAVSHGAYAQIVSGELEEHERAIFDALSADAPLRDGDGTLPDADAVAVSLLAECMVRLDRVRSHVRDYGLLTAKGSVRPVVELERRLRAEALDLCESLAMTPRSRARIGVDLVRAVTNEAEAEANREARARLDARLAALDADADEVQP